MGLDFDHSNAHWTYSGFHNFRERLARSIGLESLEVMHGFGGSRSWAEVADDLKPFLDHSDCEGELSASEMRQVSPRLRAVVEAWPRQDSFGFADPDRKKALDLCDDMDALLSRDGDAAVLRFI